MTAWRFDPSRYKGRTEGWWRQYTNPDGSLGVWNGGRVVARIAGHPEIHGAEVEANARLCADAAHLLAEVVKLREELDAANQRIFEADQEAASLRAALSQEGSDGEPGQ